MGLSPWILLARFALSNFLDSGAGNRACYPFLQNAPDPCDREDRLVNATATVVVLYFFCAGNVVAQSVDKEPAAIIELGGAGSGSITGGGSSFGPTAALEVTPIENWLELEAGVTPLFSHHATEWDTDLLFKKPWTLSKKVEFMLGAGPEWVHSTKYGMTTNSVSAEAVADFMFWPSANHRFGWYLEPAYEYNFGRGREQSLGISGGLLIAIP
jgi:hypothetical protein